MFDNRNYFLPDQALNEDVVNHALGIRKMKFSDVGKSDWYVE